MKQKKEMIEIYYMGQNGQGCTVGEGGKKKRGSVLQDRVRNTRSLHQLYKTAMSVLYS